MYKLQSKKARSEKRPKNELKQSTKESEDAEWSEKMQLESVPVSSVARLLIYLFSIVKSLI